MRPAFAPTRRRALAIFGAAGVSLAALPLLGAAVPDAGDLNTGLFRWQGSVLGARASIVLAHPDPGAARELVGACLDEIERLERIFSLYRASSELSRLNGTGRLEGPSLDLVRLLGASRDFGALTEGAFDVSVQPLWRLYADHFARYGKDAPGPERSQLSAALARVDYRAIEVEPARVRLGRPGMALTLNGIAQGYIADRVAELLCARGVEHVLLDLGEMRALGPRPDGEPWQVGMRDPFDPRHDLAVLPLHEGAVASSGGYGFVFDRTGRHHHLFDPKTGESANGVAGVTVRAAEATAADALSTALAVVPPERAAAIVRAVPGAAATLVLGDGSLRALPA